MIKKDISVVIIGAGAAGIGMGIMFEKCGIKNYLILERDEIASSFSSWPVYTRFISPSFAGNFFNVPDLNAISPDTSPAFTLKTEHPTGKEYVEYIELVTKHFNLKVREHTNVVSIKKNDKVFEIQTNKGLFKSSFVIWAGGEFQNPAIPSFPGAKLGIHSSHFKRFPENKYTIIGGFESGMELAAHILSKGKTVNVIDAGEPWVINGSDSSISLAPSTHDRLKPFMNTKKLRLYANSRVVKIEEISRGYRIVFKNKKQIISPTRPILATGFQPLSEIVSNFFEYTENGDVKITDNDESTKTEGLFLVGPRVKHNNTIFCFIYKFRQRFPIVAETIAGRLGKDITDGIAEYKKVNMYLKDLSCCTNECSC